MLNFSCVNFGHMKVLGIQDLLLVFVPMQRAISLLIMLQSALLLHLRLLQFTHRLDVSILFASFAEKNTLRTFQVHTLLVEIASESGDWNLHISCTVQSRVILKLGELFL